MLLTVALDSQPDSRKRKRSSRMLQRLAEFLNLEINLRAYQGHYNQPDKARDLPSDELISTWRDKIPNQNWQWIFGMLATFGLRPHEAWFCELEDPLTLKVMDGKTDDITPVAPVGKELVESLAFVKDEIRREAVIAQWQKREHHPLWEPGTFTKWNSGMRTLSIWRCKPTSR